MSGFPDAGAATQAGTGPEAAFNPFPGLRQFEAEEDYLFFGRQDNVDELLARLRSTRFLSVVGTSGSGKSSLVRAGLIPSLHGGFMTRAGTSWRVAVMRPGDTPIGNLAAALSDPEVLGTNDDLAAMKRVFVETTLRASELGLAESVRQSGIAPGDNVLVVVDQFEELFRYKHVGLAAAAREESVAFVKLLLAGARQSELPVYVVLTMRSDFIGNCMEFPGLPEAVNDGQYLVPRMTRNGLREAIIGPAAVAGGEIAPRLVLRLLNDIGEDMDQLPVLQHSLMRMWDLHQREDHGEGPLDIHHYQAVGTLRGALSQHAEEAYAELEPSLQIVCEKLFKGLTDRTGGGAGVRRPATVAELCALTGGTQDEVEAVVECFRREGRTFLVPPAGSPLEPASRVDISHESLMRIWRRLAHWATEDAEAASFYLRLAEAARLNRRGETGLWRDPELQLARNWRERNRPTAVWAQRYDSEFDESIAFLERSVETWDREVANRENARRKALRRMQLIAAVSLVAAVTMAAVWQYARHQRARAEAQSIVVAANLAHDPMVRAAILARLSEGVSIDAHLMTSLRKIAHEPIPEDALYGHGGAVLDVDFSPDDRFLVTGSADGTAIIWPIAGDQPPVMLPVDGGHVLKVQFSPDGSQVLTVSADGRRCEWRGRKLKDCIRGNMDEMHAVLSPDGSLVAAARLNPDIVQIRSTESGDGGAPIVLDKHTWKIAHVAFSADGKRIVTASQDNTARVWDVGNGDQIVVLQHDNWVSRAGLSPDGARVITVSRDGVIRLWNLQDHTRRSSEEKMKQINARVLRRGKEFRAAVVAFSPDGRRFVLGRGDGVAEVLPIEGSIGGSFLLEGHGAAITSAAFSHDGKRIVTGSEDASVRVWPAEGAAGAARSTVLVGHEAWVWKALFSPGLPGMDGGPTRVASGSYDCTARIWSLGGTSSEDYTAGQPVQVADLESPQDALCGHRKHFTGLEHSPHHTLRGHRKQVSDLAFSPDGTRLVTASTDSTARIWSLDTDTPPIELEGHEKGVVRALFDPEGTRVATASLDGTVRVWIVDGTDPAVILRGDGERVVAVAFSPDGSWLVGASGSGNAYIWRADGQDEPTVLEGHRGPVLDAVFNADGSQVATASRDRTVRLWSTAKGTVIRVLRGHRNAVHRVRFGASGGTLLSVSADKTVRIWNSDGSEPRVLTHGTEVNDATFSPDGRQVATAADDGRVRLWSTQGDRPPIVLPGHAGPVTSVAFEGTGDYLVTASRDKTVRIWSPGVPVPLDDPQRLLDYLRTATRACLRPEQLARYLDMPRAEAKSEYQRCEQAKQRSFGAAYPGIATAESETAK